ncbi:hypothetical protein CYMTET_4467 [Cymbomonas tetramitiformis]|uniref:J domain-containing protein n=1 Tax=Cymbomonas tetramitiformis TaxID=36881 RepID=A0AAE0LJV0_9CHLO|nr:hypothetical protein CYMTET_4467 [Cymbomonas tetramitiformis]
MPTHYGILKVEKSATVDDIKKQYRKLAKERHPDKGGSQKEFQELSEAYKVLSSEVDRRNYDLKLRQESQHSSPKTQVRTRATPQRRTSSQQTKVSSPKAAPFQHQAASQAPPEFARNQSARNFSKHGPNLAEKSKIYEWIHNQRQQHYDQKKYGAERAHQRAEQILKPRNRDPPPRRSSHLERDTPMDDAMKARLRRYSTYMEGAHTERHQNGVGRNSDSQPSNGNEHMQGWVDIKVYITRFGTIFHTRRDCWGLRFAFNLQTGDKAQAVADGLQPCPVCSRTLGACGPAEPSLRPSLPEQRPSSAPVKPMPSGRFYVTPSSQSFHRRLSCSGIKGASGISSVVGIPVGRSACALCCL